MECQQWMYREVESYASLKFLRLKPETLRIGVAEFLKYSQNFQPRRL